MLAREPATFSFAEYPLLSKTMETGKRMKKIKTMMYRYIDMGIAFSEISHRDRVGKFQAILGANAG